MFSKMLKRVRAQLSQSCTGIACAFATAALSGTGSILFKRFPDFYLRNLGGWWSAPRWHTVWAGSLTIVAVAWCCHAILRVRDSVSNQATPADGSSSRLGLTILQVGWVLALGAYLWLEVHPAEEKFEITTKGTAIRGEIYRVMRVEARGRRPGSRRPITAWLERRVGTASERLRVNRRQSWASASGTYQLAMDRVNVVNDSVILRHGHRRLEVSPSKPVQDGSDTIQLHSIRDPEPESSTSVPKADVSIGS